MVLLGETTQDPAVKSGKPGDRPEGAHTVETVISAPAGEGTGSLFLSGTRNGPICWHLQGRSH